jgi:hypothetical protein
LNSSFNSWTKLSADLFDQSTPCEAQSRVSSSKTQQRSL